MAQKTPAKNQPARPDHPILDWQNILWREWRNCPDLEYARHLFALLGSTGLGLGAMTAVALLGTLYGMLAGYWLGLLLAGWQAPIGSGIGGITLPLAMAWVVGVVGGIMGILAGQGLPWRVWLDLLTPRVIDGRWGDLCWFNTWLLAGFIAGLLLGPLTLIPAFIILLFSLHRFKEKPSKETGAAGAKALAMLVGAAGSSLTGQTPWLSTGAGLLVGGWLGLSWGGLPLGLLAGLLGLLGGLPGLGPLGWLPAWLGFGVGFAGGLLPSAAGRGLAADTAYTYRPWYFWWRRQPPITEVVRAIQQGAPDLQIMTSWPELLRRLPAQSELAGQLKLFIGSLQSADWRERCLARCALLALGGEVTEVLREIAADPFGSLQPTAVWLLAGIQQETTHRLALRTRAVLCPRCWARFSLHTINLPWGGLAFTYYGCRVCRQSREVLDWSQVIAVLDAGWTETHRHQSGVLRVNWLTQRRMVDFDSVEIVQASDEQVERMAMQVGNDTDPLRRLSYSRMRCRVASPCQLSENTRRILGRTFGQVNAS